MNIYKEIKRFLKLKLELPPCGTNGEVMWCYCGKCKSKEFGLPEDFRNILTIKAVENYKADQKTIT